MNNFDRLIYSYGNNPRRRWARLLYHSLTGKYLWGVIQFWIDWHIHILPPGWKYQIWTKDTPGEPIYYSRPQRCDEWIGKGGP